MNPLSSALSHLVNIDKAVEYIDHLPALKFESNSNIISLNIYIFAYLKQDDNKKLFSLLKIILIFKYL